MQVPWWKRLDITQVAVGLMTLKVLMPLSIVLRVPEIVNDLLLGIALFLLLFSFEGKVIPSVKTFFIVLILCGFAAYTCLVSDDFSILIAMLSIAVLCFYDTRSFIRVIFWVSVAFYTIHVLFFLGSLLLGDSTQFFHKSNTALLNFGTVHPNTASSLFSSIMLMYLWLYGEKYRGIKLLICLALQFAIYFATDSRTALLVSVISIFLLAWTYWKPPTRLLRLALCTVIPALAIFMLVMMRLYLQDHSLALNVNKILSNRVMLGACAYEHYGLTFFGKYIAFHTEKLWSSKWPLSFFTFDNTYSYLLIQGGIIWIAVLSWFFALASKRLSPKNMVFLLAWALYAMCENTVLNGYTMFGIFLLANVCRHKSSTEVTPPRKNKLFHWSL